MGPRITSATVAILAFCAGTAVSFLTLPIWVTFAINFAKHGSRTDWLGFDGAVLSASATLVAAGGALFAAYKTLAPMRDQLNQLVKQNDHILYDRLRKRAADLNQEIIVIQRVCSGCELADQTLRKILQSGAPLQLALPPFEVAVDRLSDSINDLQKARGEVWGDVRTQIERTSFIDHALLAGALITSMLVEARNAAHVSRVTLNQKLPNWDKLRSPVAILGNQVYIRANLEMQRIGAAISDLEARLLV